MKKILLSIITFLLTLTLITPVLAKVEAEVIEDKVPVYIFSKNGCSGCEYAFNYFNNLEKEYPDLFEQYIIEVYDGNWNVEDQNAYNLLISLLERNELDTVKIYTPTIFIGDYVTVGFPNDDSQVYNAILAVKDATSEEKVDMVKEEADKLDIDLEKYKKVEEKTNVTDLIIIGSIFIVLIGGFIGLIVVSKK